MRSLNPKVLAVAAALIASSVAALAANTTFFTSIGDLVFPITAPSNAGATPGTIDNMTIGATTPAAATINGLSLIQGAAVAHDTATTFAVADFTGGLVTSNPAAAIALTLPLATAMDTGLPSAEVNWSIDFAVINTASTGTDTDTMTTNTGWTLVGNMVITPLTTGGTSARFRARRTGTGAWTLYRLS
ncbi:MAG TPA: hypothetical protein VIO16_10760 [Dehalococcoidia bacterium]